MTDPTEKPRTRIDPDVYHRICALIGNLNHMYQCLCAAGDDLRKAGDAMNAVGSVCSNMAMTVSGILEHMEPADTINPTEE